ncbi:MAG: YegP family protein [Chromatiaceae bacterium]|nr:YegP family protein [Gammaproteobacteria bacterium]MCP5426888.1 YegP family protein [Chromatiaceae bacterium]MCB1861580.1 YegP family protein [Gammaproteobacteria bacterium]MCB1871452.1 YegP family protein [Gammaproteobacteria bacterium]MCB1880191.1 YegP family protein [Gammaproteobacteria bacterium]
MDIVLKMSQAEEPFSFSFINAEGQAVVKSENYKAKKSALSGIESVKKNCLEDARYEMKESKNGKFFFNVKASNGQVVGTSMLFATEADRSKAVAELKSGGPGAAVTEQSA